MKKILSIILTICLIITIIPLGLFNIIASAETTTYTEGYYTYTIANGEATISNVDVPSVFEENYKSQITLPSEFNGIPVVKIGDSAFSNDEDCGYIKKIIIPEGIIEIGDYTFKKCYCLEEISFPKSIAKIGAYAFNDTSLISIVNINDISSWCKILFDTYDSNPVTISNKIYINGSELKEIVLPDGLTKINSYAFAGCKSIEKISIPNTVTEIGDYAFSGCSSLSYITIPNSVTSIGYHAFGNCTNLTSITIPNSVTNIGACAFVSCSNLSTIDIPVSVPIIGGGAFDYTAWHDNQSDGLIYIGGAAYEYKGECPETIIIKDGTLSISTGAFSSSTNLKSITIPASVTVIGNCAFSRCFSLNNIFYKGSFDDKANIQIESESFLYSHPTWHYNSCIGSANHKYENECDTICNVCLEERSGGEHQYDNSCDNFCNECGFERQIEHTYGNDRICDICGNKDYITGDLDGIPGVTDADAVYLLYHTFLSDIYPVNQDCDFNGDGEVNDKDAVYLLYYTFLPDLYPIN